jgi:hypothetical protein
MRGIQRGLDILRLRTGDLANDLAGDGRHVLEIAPVPGRDPCAADEIVITGREGRLQRRNRAILNDGIHKPDPLPG